MTDEMKPVKCGCGGEAEIDWVLEPSNCYMANVYCNKCGMKTIPFWSEDKDKAIDYAVTTWNRAMGADAYKSSATERTAKAKVNFKDENYFFGWCECGQYQSSQFPYCPACGARLEWK